jgi:hypothetical protein
VPEVNALQGIVLEMIERYIIIIHEIDDSGLERNVIMEAAFIHILEKMPTEHMIKVRLDFRKVVR